MNNKIIIISFMIFSGITEARILDFVTETWLFPDFLKRYTTRLLMWAVRIPKPQKYINDLNRKFISNLKTEQVAPYSKEANSTYELPPRFFELFMGPYVKYSANYFEDSKTTLAQAEIAAMEMYCDRVGLENGMTVCDLGTGWGSLALFIAEKYPKCTVVAISISPSQITYVRRKARSLNLKNIILEITDIANFVPQMKFDRIFAIEILEYLKNYEVLFNTISKWLVHDGRIFIQAFAHKERAFEMKIPNNNSWIATFFCRGGTLPSRDLFLYFQNDLVVVDHYIESGLNYSKTADVFLDLLYKNEREIIDVLNETLSLEECQLIVKRYRFVFILMSELFRQPEFLLTYYVFKRR
jgi:cyclopropane fatty-acyl-phospholipid synthase-like methyltransferase